ncbi:multidrug effflux MFS transporter [Gellertiella hungarica]
MSTSRMTERRTSLLGALLTALGPIAMAIYTPSMPKLVEVFSTTEAAVKMSLSLYFAGFALAQLVGGPLSDAFGRRKATLLFLGIFIFGSLLAALATDVRWLLAGRLVQGIGASIGAAVARAIVRDQFTGPQAARIMNTIGIMLSVGPALAPTVGGMLLAAFGWQSIFLTLLAFGLVAAGSVLFFMKETADPDRSLARPGRLLRAYGSLLADLRFLCGSSVLMGTIGALYAQSTMLPFILIKLVGLTPTQFGMGMLAQTGSYFLGSLALRQAAPRLGGHRAAMTGLGFTLAGAISMLASTHFVAPSYLSIMLPVALCTFGLAMVSPHVVTATLAPFPHVAGSASALMGFIQMGGGFVAGSLAALVGTPLQAFGVIIPAMELLAVASYIVFVGISRRHGSRSFDQA